MIAPVLHGNQRWWNGGHSFRPLGEPFEPRRYEVSPIPTDNAAKAFVERHHYSGSYPAARERLGLYRGPDLVGVGVFSVPCRPEVLTNVFPIDPMESVELGRFVLLDEVPGNAESWFLARAFTHLRREGYAGVVSFSDPFPRSTIAGEVVFPGHMGTIYQASNANYLGTGQRRTIRLLPDGRVFSARSASKIRAGERGWRYSAELLVAAGATRPRGDLRAWLSRWLPRVTRAVRHPGHHRYAFRLRPRVPIVFGPRERYPKTGAAR